MSASQRTRPGDPSLPRGASYALGTRDVARLLGVSPFAIRAWRYRGCGPPYYRLPGGGHAGIRYSLDDVLAWLLARRVIEGPERAWITRQRARSRERTRAWRLRREAQKAAAPGASPAGAAEVASGGAIDGGSEG